MCRWRRAARTFSRQSSRSWPVLTRLSSTSSENKPRRKDEGEREFGVKYINTMSFHNFFLSLLYSLDAFALFHRLF